MSDGLRWQEIFNGAEASLLDSRFLPVKSSAGKNSTIISATRKLYVYPTIEERRRALMPFLWGAIAESGQIFGNRVNNSNVVVTNGVNISYPGYNETLTGQADPRLRTNDKRPNRNVTVLEWLNLRSEFHGRVAAFGAWDAFSAIFNKQRCGFPVNSGYEPFHLLPNDTVVDAMNRLKTNGPKLWEEEPSDEIPFYTALEYLKVSKPRVLFIGLGETDDWAHANDYPSYLDAVHRADQYLRILWETLQSMPEYRDSTTILFTADHGRGTGANWSEHGAEISGSEQTWFAIMGPDTPALGERIESREIRQTQFAATIAALLGQDYTTSVPYAGEPIQDVFNRETMLAHTKLPQERARISSSSSVR